MRKEDLELLGDLSNVAQLVKAEPRFGLMLHFTGYGQLQIQLIR